MPGSVPDADSVSLTTSPGCFATTRWTVIVRARSGDTPEAQEALGKLCATYWYPLYAFVRRQGHGAHDAQDLTQEFFARLLEKRFLDDVDRSKGRFRSFLLAAMKHFLANEWDKARAQKRGGCQVHVPIQSQDAEARYGAEPAHEQTPEKLFDRRWATTVLDEVLARLREEQTRGGRAAQFEALKASLTAEKGSVRYSELGAALGMTEGAVKVAVHRLRQRYRELLRDEIAQTVADASEVDEELRYLFAALA